MRALLGVIPFLWACHNDAHDSAASGGDDSVPVDDSSDPEDDLGCDKLRIDYEGPNPPHVGQQWILQLWCDDALMTLTIIRFDPTDFASVPDGSNVATFLMAGEGTIQMQAGTQREYLDVTVLE